MGYSITSADAAFNISVPDMGLTFDLENWSADGMYDLEPKDRNEVSMSIDGKLSAGKVFTADVQTIKLQANSVSIAAFNTWVLTEKAWKTPLQCQGILVLNSAGKIFTFTNGFITKSPSMPSAEKTLRPVSYTITWEDVNPG